MSIGVYGIQGRCGNVTSIGGVRRDALALAAIGYRRGQSKNRRQDDVLIGGGWMARKSRCHRGLRERGLAVSTMTTEDSPSNQFLLGLSKKSYRDTDLPSLPGFACPGRSFGSRADRGEPGGPASR